MNKYFVVLLPLMAAAGTLHAQVTDTTATNQTDSLQVPTTKTLKGVKISAKKPLYAVDGEKQLYNTSEDPSVQTGTASDALQNAPGIEVDAEGNITLRGSQSVEIWINDRPSNLSGESLRQYIKTLPANTIERIEVITNPSARYGDGGPVVNIVTTAKVSRNEFISFGTNANIRPQVSPWLSYVYANERFSINAYIEYDYSHTFNDQTGSAAMLTPTGDTSAVKFYTSHIDYWRPGSYFYVGGQYDIDTQRTIAFWSGAYPSVIRSESSTDMTWLEMIYSPGDYSYQENSSWKFPQCGYYGGLDYTRRFDDKGKQLWLRAYSNGFGYNSSGTQLRQYNSQSSLDFSIRDKTISNNWAQTSLDGGFSLPFAEHWELEIGAGLGYDFPSSYIYTSDSLPSLNRDTLRSYERAMDYFKYQAYTTLLRRFGDLTVKVGLQLGEKYSSATYTGYTHTETKCHWLVSVPSLHITYQTKNMNKFTFSYTHRSFTPDAEQLTSFVIYDTYSYRLGNPLLVPGKVHTVEGGWSRFFEGFGNLGVDAFFRSNTDEIATLSDVTYSPVFGREVSFSQPVNIGNSYTGGITFNITFRPTALFNVRLNASLYNESYNVQFRPSEWYNDNIMCGSVRINLWAKLWKRLQVFGNIRYSTRQISLMQYHGSQFTADAGFSADFWDRKLSLYLNLKDIFASNVQKWQTTNPYLNTTGSSSSNSRYISIGATLRFGKMELENQARTHSGDS